MLELRCCNYTAMFSDGLPVGVSRLTYYTSPKMIIYISDIKYHQGETSAALHRTTTRPGYVLSIRYHGDLAR